MPKRIQRSRAKSWRMPEGAIIVDRSTPWGNPFVVGQHGTAEYCVKLYKCMLAGWFMISCPAELVKKQKAAEAYFRKHVRELRGKDLVCWCRTSKPCHADVLLELANG